MDGVEGLVPKDSEGASGERADEERAEKTRSVSDGNIIDVIFGEFGVCEGFVNDG